MLPTLTLTQTFQQVILTHKLIVNSVVIMFCVFNGEGSDQVKIFMPICLSQIIFMYSDKEGFLVVGEVRKLESAEIRLMK